MKMVIFSCNTGGGHNSAARALLSELSSRGHECVIKDALDFTPRIKKDFTEVGHSVLYKWAPNFYGKTYDKIDSMRKHNGLYFDYARFAPQAAVYLYEGKFDAAICVHAFPAFMLNAARNLFDVHARCFFVSTDYSVAPGLEKTALDAYFFPEGERNKMAQTDVFETGIPIDSRYYEHIDKSFARKALGLRDDMKLVLIEAGSIGCGPIRKIADRISAEMGDSTYVAVLCGNNEKLREELSAETQDAHFLAIGFTDKVLLWTKAADVVISKAGGLSVTEIASAGVPLICMNAVPGLERKNLETMLEWGCAITANSIEGICKLAKELCRDESKRQEILKAQRAHFSVNSVVRIADYIEEYCSK